MPRVDRVLARPDLADVRDALGARLATEMVRGAIDAARAAVLTGSSSVPTDDEIASEVHRRAGLLRAGRARRVINATGVLLHTNLGRAPLSARAASAIDDTARGYSSIELDLASGKRGPRAAFLDATLAAVCGAESAFVVNNCAAAVMLLLAGLARGREVIVSRGELVEIGGGFRVPDVMAESGARLVEVGTTNKTRVADYARALDAHPDAAAILRVHQGNFRQIGFVERPALADLGALAKQRNVLLLKDLGGGALVDLGAVGLKGEPRVSECLAAGCAAVTFSADKVLGGPQGGVIAGEASVVNRLRKHPLARALRLGRLPIAALEATLEAYVAGTAWEEIPALAMARMPLAELEARVDRWVATLASAGVPAEKISTEAEMGGGTLAGRPLPSVGLSIPSADPDDLARRLRMGDPAVVGRVVEGAIVLDSRTVRPGEDEALLDLLKKAGADGARVLSPPLASG